MSAPPEELELRVVTDKTELCRIMLASWGSHSMMIGLHVYDVAEIDALGRRLALRRTSMEDATRLIDDFAASADPASLAGLYLATFEHINTARDRILEGIGRYARKQATLDAEINEKRRELNRLSAAEPPDFDAIDRIEADVDWSTRIFIDRQQSLTYVCETPVILEQRAFALGRAVAARLPAPAPAP